MNPIDEFMFWLMAPFGGIDGRTLLIVVLLVVVLIYLGRTASQR